MTLFVSPEQSLIIVFDVAQQKSYHTDPQLLKGLQPWTCQSAEFFRKQ